MKVYINPGHDLKYDSGAVNLAKGLRECDVAFGIATLVAYHLSNIGIETKIRQSDNLYYDSSYADRPVAVIPEANEWEADIFISIHCNAFNGVAKGTETEIYSYGGEAERLAKCVQRQIVDSLNTVDRGIKERPNLMVLRKTNMPAILIETAFIDNSEDVELLVDKQDDFARAIARAVTDYQCGF